MINFSGGLEESFPLFKGEVKQARAELCQAQVELEVNFS